MPAVESTGAKNPAGGPGLDLAARYRLPVLGGLAGITALAWIYLVNDAARMDSMAMGEPAAMMAMRPWGWVDLSLLFLMWSVMMAAMMVPSVTPAVLIYATLVRRMTPDQPALLSVGMFLLGYLADWTAFSLAAVGLQWGLDRWALLSPMMVSISPYLGGGLLIAAGVYQWTPIKDACLKHCKAPLTFLAQHWRYGAGGAFRMGLHHGLYCIGCCWVIMGLLFVGGVMNLLWVAALSIFVLLEKLVPLDSLLGRGLSGLASVTAGVLFMAMAG
ncbi:MAG: DUF2182 domain-containing protein [bacterium]